MRAVRFQGCNVLPAIAPHISEAHARTSSPAVEMFAAARAQMRIKHPNVLRVLGVHENSEWPCVLLELAEGGDVTEWYTQEANRGLQWKLALYVHCCGLAHLWLTFNS